MATNKILYKKLAIPWDSPDPQGKFNFFKEPMFVFCSFFPNKIYRFLSAKLILPVIIFVS